MTTNRLVFVGLLGICVALGPVAPLEAETPKWSLTVQQCCNEVLLARSGQSSVYDPASNRMVIFGGQIYSPNTPHYEDLNDVWVLTNANGTGGEGQWINLTAQSAPGSPPPRWGARAVYDQAKNRMIVFGGCGGGCRPILNDVWVLTNANGLGGTPTWLELFPVGGPPAGRVAHVAVYDNSSNSMTIFAGQVGSGSNGDTYSDVWVLSNANGLKGTPTWRQLSPSGGPPPGQYAASAVYNPSSTVMTVFGGYAHGTGLPTNSVWTLSHANGQGGTPIWTNTAHQGASGVPSERAFQTAVYDASANRMTIFGGQASRGIEPAPIFNDVWVLSHADGTGGKSVWAKIVPGDAPKPSQRAEHTAAYDSAHNLMIVFGGTGPEGVFYSTWVLSDANGL